jgi:uncharacterized membrane protein
MSTFPTTASKATSAASAPKDWLRLATALFVIIGIGISGYLSYVKLAERLNLPGAEMQCIGGDFFNCDVVQSSSYAELFGIPIAWLGLGSYLIIGALLLLENRTPFLRDYGILLNFGVVVFAFLFSVYLVYLQVFVLEALCQWCLMHELNITIIFILFIPRLRRSLASTAS